MKSKFLNFLNRLGDYVFKPILGVPIYLFRILFGLVLCYQSLYYINIDYVFQYITGPEFLFEYEVFSFLEPLPYRFLVYIQYGLLLFSILFTLGIFYRIATLYLLIGFFYFTFIDTTLYNNHLYLFILFLFVMIFIPADRKISIKSILSSNNSNHGYYLKGWHLYILQFLIFLTYFFGGISKLNVDWLDLSLPAIIMNRFSDGSNHSLWIYIVAYGGLLFDLFIIFILSRERWFLFGFVLVLIFNVINGIFLFNDIGVFPLFMVLSTILFVPLSWFDRFGFKSITQEDIAITSFRKKITLVLLAVFVSIQMWLPIRHYFLTYNPEWTGIASRFIWHMKMQSKKINTFNMTIQDGVNENIQVIDYQSFLSSNQTKNLLNDPKCLIQFSNYLAEKAKRNGLTDPVIKANIQVSFNGRRPQLLVNPEIDLSKIDFSNYQDQSWLIKLIPK